MAETLTILVGTMTGTAELCAEEMSDTLIEAGHDVEVTPMDDLDATVFADGGLFLICSSTYGQGDVPDNAVKFYEDLNSAKPDLGNVRYGVFSLGDRTYSDTYNFGGKKFDAVLGELGAKRIGEVSTHDASDGTIPEDLAIEWVKGWIEQVAGSEAAAA